MVALAVLQGWGAAAMNEKSLIVLLLVTFCLFSIHAVLGQRRPNWLDNPQNHYGSWIFVLFVKFFGVAGAITGFISWFFAMDVISGYAWPWYFTYPGYACFLSGILLTQHSSMKIASPVAGWFE